MFDVVLVQNAGCFVFVLLWHSGDSYASNSPLPPQKNEVAAFPKQDANGCLETNKNRSARNSNETP